jgi:hypothetical protein
MKTVFNGPMATIEHKESFRGCFLWGEAGNTVGSFKGFFLRFYMSNFSADAEDLPYVRKIEIVV